MTARFREAGIRRCAGISRRAKAACSSTEIAYGQLVANLRRPGSDIGKAIVAHGALSFLDSPTFKTSVDAFGFAVSAEFADHREDKAQKLALVGRHDDLRLNHQGAQPAVIACDARLPDHRGATAMQRGAFGASDVSNGNAGEEKTPTGMLAKKFVLLSMVAVRPPFGRLAMVAVPPRLSARAMTAPPCSAPNRLLSSSRTGSSAMTLSFETCDMPIKVANGGCNAPSGFMSEIIVTLGHAVLVAGSRGLQCI
jgi:hypothetical protein